MIISAGLVELSLPPISGAETDERTRLCLTSNPWSCKVLILLYSPPLAVGVSWLTIGCVWMMISQLLTNRLSPHLDNIIHLDQTAPHDFSVPSRLAKRFQDAIYINRPPLFHLLSHFPLEEGWDALVYHLSAVRKSGAPSGLSLRPLTTAAE